MIPLSGTALLEVFDGSRQMYRATSKILYPCYPCPSRGKIPPMPPFPEILGDHALQPAG